MECSLLGQLVRSGLLWGTIFSIYYDFKSVARDDLSTNALASDRKVSPKLLIDLDLYSRIINRFIELSNTVHTINNLVLYEYTCRLMNRRLALHAWARSSLPTAPTQLVIIMTTHTPLGLVRPACAPTAIDRCRALPPTTPLALLVTVFPA